MINIKKITQKNTEQLYKIVNELAELAFCYGINLDKITIRDNWMQPMGDRNIYTIPVPDIKKIETKYMNIKVKVIHR